MPEAEVECDAMKSNSWRDACHCQEQSRVEHVQHPKQAMSRLNCISA